MPLNRRPRRLSAIERPERGRVLVAANLPYSVGTPLLVGWLKTTPWPRSWLLPSQEHWPPIHDAFFHAQIALFGAEFTRVYAEEQGHAVEPAANAEPTVRGRAAAGRSVRAGA